MKFILAVAALAAGVYAGDIPTLVLREDPPTIVERDLATVTNALNDIQSNLQALDSAVTGFSGDQAPLVSAADTLASSITQGTSSISGTDALGLDDAVLLQGQVSGLQTAAQTLVDDLIAQKSAFEQANLCDVVSNQTSTLASDSQDLINAIVAQVPTEAQTIASNIASGFTDTIQQSQDAYASGNCTNGGGGDSGGASPSSTATGTGGGSSRPSSTGSGSASRTSGVTAATASAAAAVANVVPVAGLGVVGLAFMLL